jgi:hypothetical protein
MKAPPRSKIWGVLSPEPAPARIDPQPNDHHFLQPVRQRSPYYVGKLLLRMLPYYGAMSKKIISFRLSESELQVLDLACHRFSESRSRVIGRAIKSLLNEYVEQEGKLIRRPYWLPNLDGKYNEER